MTKRLLANDRGPAYCYKKRNRGGKGGREFWYFMKKGLPSARLPNPDAPEFLDAYNAALAGKPLAPKDRSKAGAGTMAALVETYLESDAFVNGCSTDTQVKYRRVLDRIKENYGPLPVAKIERRNVHKELQKFVATPSQGNLWLKIMSNLMNLAIKLDMRPNDDNPCEKVDRLNEKKDEVQPWSEGQRAKFEECWEVGTRERLAYELLLITSRRQSDVWQLGPQHMQEIAGETYIVFAQEKTEEPHKSPVPPRLMEAIAAMPKPGGNTQHLRFILTERETPFSGANSFGNWFRKAIAGAGLKGQVKGHGLRATLPTDAAEHGATDHELKAMTGHKQTAMVEKYTRKANQRRNALAGMSKVISFKAAC